MSTRIPPSSTTPQPTYLPVPRPPDPRPRVVPVAAQQGLVRQLTAVMASLEQMTREGVGCATGVSDGVTVSVCGHHGVAAFLQHTHAIGALCIHADRRAPQTVGGGLGCLCQAGIQGVEVDFFWCQSAVSTASRGLCCCTRECGGRRWLVVVSADGHARVGAKALGLAIRTDTVIAALGRRWTRGRHARDCWVVTVYLC